jgi:hypothetical protein
MARSAAMARDLRTLHGAGAVGGHLRSRIAGGSSTRENLDVGEEFGPADGRGSPRLSGGPRPRSAKVEDRDMNKSVKIVLFALLALPALGRTIRGAS